jgi:hypothetical protein
MDENYVLDLPTGENLNSPATNRGHVTNGLYSAGSTQPDRERFDVEEGTEDVTPSDQETLVSDEPSMSARELQQMLVMIEENEYQNPKGALQRIKFFVKEKLGGRRASREYRENATNMDRTAADMEATANTSATVDALLERRTWNFSNDAINMAIVARLENRGQPLNEAAQARLRDSVRASLERWKSLQSFETEMNRNLQTTSTERLLETLPQMVDAYALRNRRTLTLREREVLLNHARQMVDPQPEVLGNANLLYAEIERNGNFNIPRREIARLAQRFGTNRENRQEIAEEVRRRVAEHQMVEQAGHAIHGNIIRGLTYDFNRPFNEYIDQTIAAHVGENRLNLTPTEIARFRKRFAGEREYFETIIAQRRENVVRNTLNQVNNRLLTGLDDRLTTPIPQYIEGTLNNYIRENNLTLTPQEIQGLRERFLERQEAYQQKIEEVRRQKAEMALHKERKEDGIYTARAAILEDIGARLEAGEVHRGNMEAAVEAAIARYIGQNPETGTIRNYIRPRHRGYLEASIREAVAQQVERDLDFARTEAEIEDKDRNTERDNNYVAETTYTTSRDLLNEIDNANMSDEEVINLVQNRLRDQDIPDRLRGRIENEAAQRVMNRLTARRLEPRRNIPASGPDSVFNQRDGQSRVKQGIYGREASYPQPAPEAPNREKPLNERIHDQMEGVATRVLRIQNGTMRDIGPEEIRRVINEMPDFHGQVELDGVYIDKNRLANYVLNRRNNFGKNSDFWGRR